MLFFMTVLHPTVIVRVFRSVCSCCCIRCPYSVSTDFGIITTITYALGQKDVIVPTIINGIIHFQFSGQIDSHHP
jgi:dissimilatory sulfite reductase (desulfoviridin) alpha/beta subunit